ncbi:MAG: IclR family transcriptional regulator [Paenibacillaceae bacterium]|jgi:IclR family KDG regulon transcriptional repressor|nr:IclR family transcriptional regulator [Paenibacillaceae bacterium]
MEKKYWVPALERANAVLRLIAEQPSKLKLSDLTKRLGISKSTMFSLLQTMESLDWIKREDKETYSLGNFFGTMGFAYFEKYDLADAFRKEAESSMSKLLASFQLACLEDSEVLYLARVSAPVPVQMVSGPGVRMPAHATALGKVLLTGLDLDRIAYIFSEEQLPKLTAHTIGFRNELLQEVEKVRKDGYALDMQEGVMGFNCVAAPVYHPNGSMVAAVSCSMPIHEWSSKKDAAIQEIVSLARRLSFETGEQTY